jgi:glutamyl-tRNA synthetase/glutamyl-Q tRNA(Asp) synthetase
LQRQDAASHGCRTRSIGLIEGVTWRLRIDDAVETFSDLLQGANTQDAAAAGDVVIRDRRGNWTYQFAVVVDDHLQGVDLVIRGLDLLPSTGLQMWMGRLLGRDAPATFAHHPLIMKSPTQKLSKSDHDTGISDLRKAGMTPAEVIGRAAYEVGLAATPTPVEAADVPFLFTVPA